MLTWHHMAGSRDQSDNPPLMAMLRRCP